MEVVGDPQEVNHMMTLQSRNERVYALKPSVSDVLRCKEFEGWKEMAREADAYQVHEQKGHTGFLKESRLLALVADRLELRL